MLWGAARRHWRSGTRSNVRRGNALQGISQWLNWLDMRIGNRGWRCGYGYAQRAIHSATSYISGISVCRFDHHFHRPRSSTNQQNILGFDDRRCDSDTQRQHKPRQHEAGEGGEVMECVQCSHGADYHRKDWGVWWIILMDRIVL